MNYTRADIVAGLRFLEPILCVVLSLGVLVALALAFFTNIYLVLLAVAFVVVLFSFYAILGWMTSHSP